MSEIILINCENKCENFINLFQKELYRNKRTSTVMPIDEPVKSIISNLFEISEKDLETYINSEDYGYAIQAYPNNQPMCNIQYGDFKTIMNKMKNVLIPNWFGENIWVELLLKRVEGEIVDFIIVPDYKYENEEISNITIKYKDSEMKFRYTVDSEIIELEVERIVNSILSK